jgi:hypothetical protein
MAPPPHWSLNIGGWVGHREGTFHEQAASSLDPAITPSNVPVGLGRVRKLSSHSSPAAQKLLEKLAAHAGAETDAATGAHRRRSNRSAHDEDESPKACVPEDAKAWAGSKVHTAPKQPDLDNPYLSKHFVVSTKLER